MTVNPTASVNGKNEMRSADGSLRSGGKRRRQRSFAGCVSERRRKRKKRKKRRIRAKKGARATAVAAPTKV